MTKEVQRSESEASKHAGRPAHSSFSTLHSSFQHYTFVDYATQGYIAFVGLIILLLHSREYRSGRSCCWRTPSASFWFTFSFSSTPGTR